YGAIIGNRNPPNSMKIKTLSISNILSFAQRADHSETPNITFDVDGLTGSLHILIGPNGSGKSNFVETLTHIFRWVLFTPIAFFEQTLMTEQRGEFLADSDRKQAIRLENQESRSIPKHRSSTESPQFITVQIQLNDNDFDNLSFLLSNR